VLFVDGMDQKQSRASLPLAFARRCFLDATTPIVRMPTDKATPTVLSADLSEGLCCGTAP
jgi:hypothetical protein